MGHDQLRLEPHRVFFRLDLNHLGPASRPARRTRPIGMRRRRRTLFASSLRRSDSPECVRIRARHTFLATQLLARAHTPLVTLAREPQGTRDGARDRQEAIHDVVTAAFSSARARVCFRARRGVSLSRARACARARVRVRPRHRSTPHNPLLFEASLCDFVSQAAESGHVCGLRVGRDLLLGARERGSPRRRKKRAPRATPSFSLKA